MESLLDERKAHLTRSIKDLVQKCFTFFPPVLLEEVLLVLSSSAKKISLPRLKPTKLRINLEQDVIVVVR